VKKGGGLSYDAHSATAKQKSEDEQAEEFERMQQRMSKVGFNRFLCFSFHLLLFLSFFFVRCHPHIN
jgi:hypothetical protein